MEIEFAGIERVDTSWVAPTYRRGTPPINSDKRKASGGRQATRAEAMPGAPLPAVTLHSEQRCVPGLLQAALARPQRRARLPQPRARRCSGTSCSRSCRRPCRAPSQTSPCAASWSGRRQQRPERLLSSRRAALSCSGKDTWLPPLLLPLPTTNCPLLPAAPAGSRCRPGCLPRSAALRPATCITCRQLLSTGHCRRWVPRVHLHRPRPVPVCPAARRCTSGRPSRSSWSLPRWSARCRCWRRAALQRRQTRRQATPRCCRRPLAARACQSSAGRSGPAPQCRTQWRT